jgi:branched-chain amino acid transport system ATP-binding protein
VTDQPLTDSASSPTNLRQSLRDLGPAGPVALLLLVALAGVQNFDIVAFGVLSPNIRSTFHLSNAGIDAIAALTGAVPVIFAVLLGYLGDRLNRLRLSQAAGLVWGLTAILTGLAPVVVLLIVARLIGGVGYLTTETVYPSLLADYYPPRRAGAVFGAYRLGAHGIGLIGGPAAGALAAVFGWRTAFVALALPTFVFVALLVVLREPARGASAGVVTGVEQMGSIGEGFRRVKAIRSLRRTWFAAFLFGAGTIPFPTLLNNFFHDVYHFGPTSRGFVSALYGVGGLLGVVICATLTQRELTAGRPSRLSLINGLMVVEFGLFIAVMGGAPWVAVSVIAAGVLSIGAYGFLPAYTALVSLVAPPALRAQAYAWSLWWYALGGIVLGSIIGGISDAHGNRVALLVLAALVAAGGAIGASAFRFVDRDVEQASRAENASQSEALLACHGVDAAYGGVQVLFGVDFEVQRGEIVALLGTNGAGKSTFLKTISGLLDPIGGAMFFKGRDISHADPATTSRLGIMQVPGGRGVFPTLTVTENLRVAGWLYRKDKAYLDEAMARVRDYFPVLDRRADTLAGDLSGGEQQMLSLAQAFLAKPDLLLIDELSLGLAPTIVDRLIDIVRAIHAGGTTVVIVEQSVHTALELAERAIFMEKGEVRFSGPTRDLLERPDVLRAVFLHGAAAGMNGKANGATAKTRAAKAAARIGDDIVLETVALSKSYGGVMAVRDVSLQLHQGEILGFVGANGAGKTTLFDLISGFSRNDGGRVVVHGHDVTSWPAWQRARLGLGRSFQDARLWPQLTVAESLAVALHDEAEIDAAFPALLGLPRVTESEAMLAEHVDRLIDLMGLEAFRNKFIGELSTGSRRMVELACMLAHRPSVLLLDEPSSGIAQRETEALGPLVKRIRDELSCSVLVIEHDMPLLRSLADTLIALDLGQVIAKGDPAAVLENPQVVSAYLGGAVERFGLGKQASNGRSRSAKVTVKA